MISHFCFPFILYRMYLIPYVLLKIMFDIIIFLDDSVKSTI
ncbi:hypothetical protein ELI_3884 [Eubacterium callanderi]|uniref:Uncharacterized protein n=1 Tax=Eubacterium callanderi TaxID=53442 RepID=E3GGM3_9FIRM|nr:hypothetical protein ELI_3884 [Eubacterium callanderi]